MPRRPAANRRGRRSALKGRNRVVSGRGFYKGFGGHVGTAVGGLAGAVNMAHGSPVPMLTPATGAQLGRYIGKRAAEATGWGAYNIKHNSILTPDLPTIKNVRSMEGATVVRHKEYICDVYSGDLSGGSSKFTITKTVQLNPGLSTGFPWLSQVAGAFQQYKLNGAMFEFRSGCGDAVSSGNSSLGEVIISTQYNVLNTAFTNKQQMLNEEFSISAKPSKDIVHPIECDQGQTPVDKLYVRSGAAASGSDLRLYDLGTTVIATQGQQAAGANLGELWITYEVLLFKPSLLGH